MPHFFAFLRMVFFDEHFGVGKRFVIQGIGIDQL